MNVINLERMGFLRRACSIKKIDQKMMWKESRCESREYVQNVWSYYFRMDEAGLVKREWQSELKIMGKTKR